MVTRMWRNRIPYTLLVGIQISTTPMESIMEIPQKAKDLPVFHMVILFLGIYPKE
jgi:hypothetical protein